MKSYKILSASLALLLGWSGTALAQSEVDALRYSRFGVTGSARIQGIGGAQSALGADISTMAVNPAGLGLFRRSEFSISPGVQLNSTDASIGGMRMSNDKSNVSIPHVGLVFSERKDDNDNSDWRGTTLGISFSRLNNFNQRLSYNNTVVPPNTIVDYFAEQANINGRTQASLDNEYDNGFTSIEGLAYGTYLIDIFEDNQGQYAEPLYSIGNISQREEIQRSGSQNRLDIGAGTSFRDRLYLGASLGIISTNFTQDRIFRESGQYAAEFDEDGLPLVDENGNIILDNYNLELRDGFTTRGTGLNLRVGIIARPVDALRLGLSIQTPTIYTITETYNRSLTATTLNPDTGSPETLTASEMPGEFSYTLVTPFRATGGVAVFLNKYGFLTADLEFVNYGSANFSEDQDDFGTSGDYFDDVNNRISDNYRSVVNYRFGAEGRYEVFRFRAGYAVSANPYSNSDFDAKINSFTLGAGIRLQNIYVDAAFVSSKGNTRYSPYTFSDPEGMPIVDLQERQNTAMLTVGYNF